MTRERLSSERPGYTQAFRLKYIEKEDGKDVVKELKLYFTANMYDDGRPGEIIITADQAGTFTRGALDAFAMMASIALQHGMPVSTIIEKLKGSQFGPSGSTLNPDIPRCSSPFDLLAKWLEHKFVPKEGT